MPRKRKRVHFSKPVDFTVLITGVRQAIDSLTPGAGLQPEAIERRKATAVHNIVFGLSRAANPPHFFRIPDRLPVISNGRPKAIEGTAVALVCRIEYEFITGRRATIEVDPETRKPYGAYFDLVKGIFEALGFTDSPINRARAALDPSRPMRRRRRSAIRPSRVHF